MTRLVNVPSDFPAEAVRGFVLANKRYVKPVFGGVVRSTATAEGKVAVVYGGGSGHYPAFAGWVGQGFADGAVCGNIFSSPSAAQAYSVLKAAHRGAGVLMGFGNYAGDVLHFGEAIERLRAEGIEADTLVVTDDIASGGKDELEKRRGIAGFLPVFKIAAAAAEAGQDFAGVKQVFAKANAATRTFGVAFAGCTLPGADGPLFTVPEGKMGIGLGIHGEPGVSEADLGTADDVAAALVDGLLDDRPAGAGNRVVAIVNGLGSTKYEELFVTAGNINDRLEAAGVEVVDLESGEFVTSLDMAGISLTLVWVDDELLGYWDAACDAPAYRKGSVGEVKRDDSVLNSEAAAVEVAEQGSPASQQVAQKVVTLIEVISNRMEESKDELGKLDAVAGDGDHGIGMTNGARAALATAKDLVSRGAGAQTTLAGAGDAWSNGAGGTSGALWGAILTAVGATLGDQDEPTDETISQALAAALQAVQRLGGAQVGDKTMVDAMVPLVEAFQQTEGTLKSRTSAAIVAAEKGAETTRAMVAKLGRSRPLGEKSVGTPDPGAVSLTRIAKALFDQI
ncbi:dihydroxyacetone kinase family protein [Tessaracoccus sp. SD287]|uniref:dihydroxyacetone kinase family protein n=1 Tax=Tessaracoccus sp. SD287 TaxID=2782008 RepID=UPI001A96B422|nr:dihydroxyacetone kinase family protein [Tessaracoccus sp. SD287]MBO1030142.1 dihydroxyacetone kinase family protein [Tessaracoccus sp. SD287]